jgi:hypothetical protein
MRTTKAFPIVSLFLMFIAGCAQNKTASNESHPSSYSSAPAEQRLTPTSDRPDAQPHIYSNSTSQATSPAVSTDNQ